MSKISFKGLGEYGEEEEENYMEEDEPEVTEVSSFPVGESEGTRGPTLAQSNQPSSHLSDPSLLAIMQQMTQIMANLEEELSFEG
ncbi:hypothetical protein O181_056409 [Austropuccinia psidii MF-1]|uniref:Uncharacterized protein n=1 Tax=Austropuccinia psidii MF-1 TaxID=1389203 RepID=A0A9Q3E8I2_9BASI|nr:hypothetical protein [Austropuccinia psidii MF-1]